jgi:serine/threonine-protein kinase
MSDDPTQVGGFGGVAEPTPRDPTTVGDPTVAGFVPQGPGTTMLGDRYEIGELLGRGGMAEVHEGYDLRLGRRVAVKILRPELARDPSFHQRFRREAHSAAALNQANIVAVYDTGEDTLGSGPTAVTVPYIVMEYVDGMTLRQLLGSGRRLLPERVLEITSGILAALDYSHRHGIVHRDIKPANVMLTKNGEVKVMDFGIARALAAHGQTMTATSQVMGTAQYLSPEQARGEVVDARSDLYSTGCVLYELLTDRPPFVGESPVSVAYQHVSEQPVPPSALDSQVTPQVDAVVLRALAKSPDQRYQTAAEFKADVDRAIVGAPVTAPVPVVAAAVPDPTAMMPPIAEPPLPPGTDDEDDKKSPWLWVGIVAGVLLLAVGAIALAQSLFGGSEVEQVQVPRIVGQSLTDAENILNAAGLRLGAEEAEASDKPEGTILAQDPPAGESLEKGQGVDVTVSGGPGQTVVPNVVGQTSPENAATQLADAKLKLGNVQTRDSDQPQGYVLSQSPEQGKSVDVGTEVNIVVSDGLVTVPNVIGSSEAQARSALSNAGLDVSVTSQENDESAGTVLAQTPNAGNQVSRGDTVTITVSTGPPTPTPTPTVTSDNQQNPDRQGQSAPPTTRPAPEGEGEVVPSP